MSEEEVVEATIEDPYDEQPPLTWNGERPEVARQEEMIRRLRTFTPHVIAGSAVQARDWAALYGLNPSRYRIVYQPKHLQGLAPNKDMVVLVGTYRTEKSWEFCELIQYLSSKGIQAAHGGPF